MAAKLTKNERLRLCKLRNRGQISELQPARRFPMLKILAVLAAIMGLILAVLL